MKQIYIVFIYFLVSNISYAQEQLIKGIIVDNIQKPIPYATIQLLNQNKKFINGTICMEDGSFTLHYPDSCIINNFQIKVSSVGYRTYETTVSTFNLGKIELEEDIQSIGEVTVISKKPIYKLENGNITTSIKNTTLSNIGKATDIIRYLPGVWGEGNSVTVLGKGTPVFYINNHRVRNQSELTMLKSDNIDNIEIVYNPGSEYDSDIQAVIKIKTINKVNESLSGKIETGSLWSDGWKYGGSGNLSYHNQKGLDCFGNIEYTNGIIAKSEVNSTTKSFTKQPWETNSNIDSEQKGYDLSTKVGLSQQFNKHHSVGIQYIYTGTQLNNNLNIQSLNQTNKEIQEKVLSDNHRNKHVNNHYLNTYYAGDFNKYWSIDFNLDMVNNTINTISNNTELSDTSNDRNVESDAIVDNTLYAIKLSTSYQKGIHKLILGSSYTNIKSISSYKEKNNITPQSETETKESTSALFVSYRLKHKRFALQTGLRYEYTSNDYNNFLEENKNQKKYYNFFLPNIAFSFPIIRTTTSLSYSQTIQRPSFHQLDGSLWYINRFLISQGNPKLTSMIKHDLTWQIIYKSFRFASTYINQKKTIFRIQKIHNEVNSIILQSYENIDKYQSLNLTASYNPTIKFWNPLLNISLTQPFFKIDTYNGKQKFNNPTLFLMCNNIFRCSKNCIVRFNLDIVSAGNTLNEHRINNGWGMDFNIQQSLCKNKFMIRFGIQDIFNTRSKYESEKFNAAVYEHSIQKDYKRSVLFSFIYNFNHQPNRYKGSMNNEINRIK